MDQRFNVGARSLRGGKNDYSAKTLNSNWVEDRCQPEYAKLPRPFYESKYDTTAQAQMREGLNQGVSRFGAGVTEGEKESNSDSTTWQTVSQSTFDAQGTQDEFSSKFQLPKHELTQPTSESAEAYRSRWTRDQESTLDQRFSTETLSRQAAAVGPSFQQTTLRQYPGVPVAVQRVRSMVVSRISGSAIPRLAAVGDAVARFDKLGEGNVTRVEFELGLADFGLEVPSDDSLALFRYFDPEDSGRISIDQFVAGIRGSPSRLRGAFLDALWEAVVDKDGGCAPEGQVTVSALASCFDVKAHPLVRSGRLEAPALQGALAAQWGSADTVSRQQVADLVSDMTAGVSHDDDFEAFMSGVWGVSRADLAADALTIKRQLVTHMDGSQSMEEVGPSGGGSRGARR